MADSLQVAVLAFVAEMDEWRCSLCESTLDTVTGDSCASCKKRARRREELLNALAKDRRGSDE